MTKKKIVGTTRVPTPGERDVSKVRPPFPRKTRGHGSGSEAIVITFDDGGFAEAIAQEPRADAATAMAQARWVEQVRKTLGLSSVELAARVGYGISEAEIATLLACPVAVLYTVFCTDADALEVHDGDWPTLTSDALLRGVEENIRALRRRQKPVSAWATRQRRRAQPDKRKPR